MNIPSLLEMLKAGVHFGHRTSKWHPSMEPFIFGERSGVHIVNLEITQKKMEEAAEYLRKLGMEGGTLLFVGTKKQAQASIKAKATECGMPYVSERWIGGTLTNFGTVRKRVERFMDLLKKRETGELKKYTKREQNEFGKEIEDLRRKFEGLVKLDKMPTAIFIMDIKTEKTALQEAAKKNIPVIAVCDTNVNIGGVKYVIPANDDAVKSVAMMVDFVAEAFRDGQNLQGAREQVKKMEEEKQKKESGITNKESGNP
ncbi:MAG: 30S ribosomal protein S2 [Patescibacteria group bacterium]